METKIVTTISKKPTQTHHLNQARPKGGRFGAHNACESCGKSAGTDYFSSPNHNELVAGVVVCETCYDAMVDGGIEVEKKMLGLTKDEGWEPWKPSAHSAGICICGAEPSFRNEDLGLLRCTTCLAKETSK